MQLLIWWIAIVAVTTQTVHSQDPIETETSATAVRKHRRGPSMASVADTLRHQLDPHQMPESEDIEQGDRGSIVRERPQRFNLGLVPRISPGWRAELLVWQSEFLGVMSFLTGAFGGIHETNSHLENALAFGLSLAVAVFLFGKSLMNPAVLLSQFLEGEMTLIRTMNLFSAEIAGAIASSGLILALTGSVPGVVALAPGVSIAQGLFIETVCAATLAYTVLLVSHEKSKATLNTPMIVGFTLVALELFAIPYTSGAVNFARALGPSVVAQRFNNYDWIYFVSNILGAISASAYYKFTRAIQESPVIEPIFGPALAVQHDPTN